MFQRKIDPLSELLRPPLHFESRVHQLRYMKQVGEALSWIDDLDFPVLVADAMVSDFPIIAVSEGFVQESSYRRDEILHGNCRILVERVTGADVYRISRSSRESMTAFCQLSRFPGTVSSGSGKRVSQPNVLGDGTCVTNHFVVFRVYVCGHPMLVGLQHFDRTCSYAPPEGLNLVNAERMSKLTTKITQSEDLQNLFNCESNLLENDTVPAGGLYCGDKVSASLLFFDGGRGVLRQEPQCLPQSGTIFTANPIPVRSDGSRRLTLRLQTTMSHTWPDEAGPPMGFTQTLPTSGGWADYTRLHFVGRTVGFTCVGPAINNSAVTLDGIGRWRDKLDVFPLTTFPEPSEGDIVTVEITSVGELKRYHNGVLLHTVATGKLLEDGDWYGAFEISMNVARVTLLEADPHLEQALNLSERKPVQVVIDVERKLAACKESRDIKDMFAILLFDAWNLSISIASTHADNSLIAVSDGFLYLTGYTRSEVIGRNCRFLSQGSLMSDQDRAAIREGIELGEHYCALIPNIRADGSKFNNLLDLRTLEVGTDEFGMPVQFIFGIQGEITRSMSARRWKLGLPKLSEALRCNIGIILHAIHSEFQISDSAHTMIKPHPAPFWLDS